MEAAIVGAVIAGLFALLAAYLGFLLQEGRKKIESTRRALADVTPPGSPDLILLQHSYSFDMESDGSCSLERRIVLHYQGNQELPTKKFLLHHEGIDFYSKAKGIPFEKLNPDAEFKILVRDQGSSVRQDAWTYIAGDHNQTLETTIKFDNPLSPQNPDVDLLITYKNLHVSFFWKKFWENHQDEWSEIVHEPIEQYEMNILFPRDLPEWFRKAEIGTALIPQNWGTVSEDNVDSRRRITLQANNLQTGDYRMRIDAG